MNVNIQNVIGKLELLPMEVGQDVFEDQVVATIETDKAAVDIKARENGTVLQVHVRVGDEIREGQQIATVMVD
jgi:pyruvate dehydrogenase E2 component (dihydrolipoamide acetyltransferase)